jgi:signal transduction histidine kinase
MRNSKVADLDFAIGRARILVSMVALLSVYVDPTNGGFLGIEPIALGILVLHLAYSVSVYTGFRWTSADHELATISVTLDVLFATVLALFTEGRPTSPAFVFFIFAIVAGGCRFNIRTCLGVTAFSVVLYLIVISIGLHRVSNLYMMRAAYLAITGYVIGFFVDQRAMFATRVHQLESIADRQLIARDLHDGYVQELAGINLRLGACQRWLDRDEISKARTEIKEIQVEVTREYDEVRKYIHLLAGTRYKETARNSQPLDQARFQVNANFATSATIVEHALQIILEGMRNAHQHGRSHMVTASVQGRPDRIRIIIDDDGVGFKEQGSPPWSIASRVAEVGGELKIVGGGDSGAHLQIDLPAM